MKLQPKSIDEHIQCLARLTGAPDSFVVQVRELFNRKGISLEDDAAPYIKALEEAFVREERIRTSSARARQELAQLHESFTELGRAHVRRMEKPARKSSRRKQSDDAPNAVAVTWDDDRTVVLRMQREDDPLVPGPSDVQ